MRVFLNSFVISIALIGLFSGIGCNGSGEITNEPIGDVQGINLFHMSAVMYPGQSLQARARAIYTGGGAYEVTDLAVWNSSDSNVITIIGQGKLNAIGGGTTVISCTFRGVTSQGITVKVEGPVYDPNPTPSIYLAYLQVQPATAKILENGFVQFEAFAVYSTGAAIPITDVADWRLSDDDLGYLVDSENVATWGPYYGLFQSNGLTGVTVISCTYMGLVSNYVTLAITVK